MTPSNEINMNDNTGERKTPVQVTAKALLQS